MYRVFGRISGPKREEVTGGWRKLHNEEYHDLYSSPSIIRMIQVKEGEMDRECSTSGEKRSVCRVLVRKPEGKRQPGRPRRKSVGNIKTYLAETGWGGMDWIDLAQERDRWRALVNTVLNFRVP
jgi:hypothetical protein